MQVVGLLVDDTFGQSDCLSKEAFRVLLISDHGSVQYGQYEGCDCKAHREVREACGFKEAILDAHDEAIDADDDAGDDDDAGGDDLSGC